MLMSARCLLVDVKEKLEEEITEDEIETLQRTDALSKVWAVIDDIEDTIKDLVWNL